MKKTRSNIVQKPQGTSRPPEADFTFCGAKVAPLRLAVLALDRYNRLSYSIASKSFLMKFILNFNIHLN
jgi:hypothetical protein